MPRIKTSTIPEQVAAHLREGIARGHWVEVLPGRDQLAVELGVSSAKHPKGHHNPGEGGPSRFPRPGAPNRHPSSRIKT